MVACTLLYCTHPARTTVEIAHILFISAENINILSKNVNFLQIHIFSRFGSFPHYIEYYFWLTLIDITLIMAYANKTYVRHYM